MADATQTARSMWTLFEPIHAVIYFTQESRSAFEQAGLRGFWRGYFAGRAAPLGRVDAAVVTASFFGFAPGMVARAVPGIWELISPADALQTRLAGATDALRRLLPETLPERLPGALSGGLPQTDVAPQVDRAADLLWGATGELDCAGRVLAAANAALAVPDEFSALARLWQAATLLREHRGDGHFAALVAAGVDGCESLVLRSGIDLRREDLQPIRGWTDEEWDDARSRLAERGWLEADGTLTAAGRHAHAAVEDATDRAAARPWARLGPQASAELAEVLTPIATACASVFPHPNPIGVPAPGTVG